MSETKTIEVPIQGMDCADCTLHVQRAIASVPGVSDVEVFLVAEKAVVKYDSQLADLADISRAVESAGYSVASQESETSDEPTVRDFTRRVLTLLGVLFGVVLFVVVFGEWLGMFETVSESIPWYVGLTLVIIAGYPVFRNVVRAARHGQVIAHTLMTVGVLAALVIGQWMTALVIVFFMRVGDYVEHFTAERARHAVKDLTTMAPQTARVERDGAEIKLPVEQVAVGEIVIVRPGECVPVDGEVVSGHAVVDQSKITGESLPVEAGPGAHVYSAAIAHQGSVRVRATQVGEDTTFGTVIRMVEQAEANKAEVQRVADRFSTYFLPVVAGIAALTFIVSRDPLATAAVLVVACSCAFALATPIAMLASIGAGAKRGLLFKGGKYVELLDKADVMLIDKTGTLTLGKPVITDICVLNGELAVIGDESQNVDNELHITNEELRIKEGVDAENEILRLAASAEKYSEHPLAEAVREAARENNLELFEPKEFKAVPGLGVRARVNGQFVEVGNKRFFDVGQKWNLLSGRHGRADNVLCDGEGTNMSEGRRARDLSNIEVFESQGKSVIYVSVDGELAGVLAAGDTLREEVPLALQKVCELGFRRIELLTGDHERTAAPLAEELGVAYQAELLPEDKIEVVKNYQERGHTVVMIGDGVNDAPALAQADVGIAMGAAGSDVAIEVADVALMRDDWLLVPEAIRISRRTMQVVRTNIIFTGVYNLVGLTLAAFGILPPVLAAAAQSLPDLGILANSSRLLRE
jgi:Cd2+/Zn2+-exporting ATPase/Cu+-exporting ATPase